MDIEKVETWIFLFESALYSNKGLKEPAPSHLSLSIQKELYSS